MAVFQECLDSCTPGQSRWMQQFKNCSYFIVLLTEFDKLTSCSSIFSMCLLDSADAASPEALMQSQPGNFRQYSPELNLSVIIWGSPAYLRPQTRVVARFWTENQTGAGISRRPAWKGLQWKLENSRCSSEHPRQMLSSFRRYQSQWWGFPQLW